MTYKVFKNILALIIAIIISGIVDVLVSKIGILPFGGLVGGLLIGISFKNREVLYGAICGIFYISLSFAVAIAIGLGTKLTIKEALVTLFSSMRAVDFLKLFLIMFLFIFGGWVGRILKRKGYLQKKERNIE